MTVLSCNESKFNSQNTDEKISSDKDSTLPEKLKPYDKNNNNIADFLEDLDGDGIADGLRDSIGGETLDSSPEKLGAIAEEFKSYQESIGDFDGDGKPDSLGSQKGREITGSVLALCDSPEVRKGTKQIFFQGNLYDRGVQCKNGLRDAEGGRASDYKKWEQNIGFSSDEAICSFSIKASESVFRYDDGLLVTLNDNALFWGRFAPIANLTLSNGLRKFDWAKVKGEPLSGDGSLGCIGGGACDVPKTETDGNVNFTVEDDMVKQSIKREISQNGDKLGIYIFGDDNDDIDCRHSGINFTIDYTYYKK